MHNREHHKYRPAQTKCEPFQSMHNGAISILTPNRLSTEKDSIGGCTTVIMQGDEDQEWKKGRYNQH